MTTVKTEPENISVMKTEINGLLKMCAPENISVSHFDQDFGCDTTKDRIIINNNVSI